MSSDLGTHFEGVKRIGMRGTKMKWLDKESLQFQGEKRESWGCESREVYLLSVFGDVTVLYNRRNAREKKGIQTHSQDPMQSIKCSNYISKQDFWIIFNHGYGGAISLYTSYAKPLLEMQINNQESSYSKPVGKVSRNKCSQTEK